jgi:hypothetical protein
MEESLVINNNGAHDTHEFRTHGGIFSSEM